MDPPPRRTLPCPLCPNSRTEEHQICLQCYQEFFSYLRENSVEYESREAIICEFCGVRCEALIEGLCSSCYRATHCRKCQRLMTSSECSNCQEVEASSGVIVSCMRCQQPTIGCRWCPKCRRPGKSRFSPVEHLNV